MKPSIHKTMSRNWWWPVHTGWPAAWT